MRKTGILIRKLEKHCNEKTEQIVKDIEVRKFDSPKPSQLKLIVSKDIKPVTKEKFFFN
jgi:hypothetical protein